MIKIKKFLKEFQAIMKVISNYSLETAFLFSEKEIIIKAIHLTNTSLCRVKICSELFEEYNIDKEHIYTINTELFCKMLKKVGKKEVILELKDEGLIMNNKKDLFKLNYYTGIKDEREFPNFNYTSIWSVDTVEFLNNILELKDFSEIFCLKDDGKLKIKTKANLIEGESVIEQGKASCSSNCFSYYTTEFFEKIENIKNVFETINVYFSQSTACFIKGEKNGIVFEWMLAPRIEEGEQNE